MRVRKWSVIVVGEVGWCLSEVDKQLLGEMPRSGCQRLQGKMLALGKVARGDVVTEVAVLCLKSQGADDGARE